MLRTGRALFLCLFVLGACVKDQQAARTRNSGIDKEPEAHETPTPEKLPKEEPPPPREQDLPPVEPPPKKPK